jgi:hypothetical protein
MASDAVKYVFINPIEPISSAVKLAGIWPIQNVLECINPLTPADVYIRPGISLRILATHKYA